MKPQSRFQSFIESTLNVLSGFFISLYIQILIFPYYNIHLSISTQAQITIIFTVASVIRGYVWRRAFNWWQQRK
jgi:hypothetical protein